MRPEDWEVKDGHAPRKPAKWHLSPSEKSFALMWQAHGGQHQNTHQLGGFFSKCWSGPHTSSMLELDWACEASHPHSKQRDEDGKSEVWPPESERCVQNLGNVTFRDREPPWRLSGTLPPCCPSWLLFDVSQEGGKKMHQSQEDKSSELQAIYVPGKELSPPFPARWSALCPPFRPGVRATKEPLVEFRQLRLAGLIGPIQREFRGGAGKHVHDLRVGRRRPRLLAARRESIR